MIILFILEVWGGYDFNLSDSSVLTPYIGFGYRYLNDDSSGMTTTTGHSGYERESNYFYFPIGIQAVKKIKDKETIELNIECDYLLKGIQKSHLSDASLGYNDLENDQNNGYGLRSSLKYNKKGKKIDWVIETFIRYWNIDDSEDNAVTYSGVIIGYGYEPENTTTEVGIKFKLQF